MEQKSISSEDSAKLPEDVKLKMLKEAKPGSWYDNWRPYCMCATMERMVQHDYGFKCNCCENMIGWDLVRLSDSPLNNPNHKVTNKPKHILDLFLEGKLNEPS